MRHIPDFGPIYIAVLVSEVGDENEFPNGRQFSAWNEQIAQEESSLDSRRKW
ncbi:IS110 family transposase [Vibrio alginolyticus]|uniref:IS110 family transposase n=1 Tax=Vibrio alginolyticus TaxID=663 RepID=UPI00215D492F|nr:IS110 family transposase [Vibrio alginolyticus]MCR9352125.1 IS110 family transposase [Vibrio alginolyticus]MCR9362560.1 IS110 family transposase [Vibrio alginolyticus]